MSRKEISKNKLEELEAFDQFAKKPLKHIKPPKPSIGANCVIYTRVSSKKQEDGYSLEIQLEATQEYAKKQGFNVVGFFGGKYESAQTDKERKEFNRMLQFSNKSKEKVSYVLVYTVDRFSRTGINGAYIKDTLRHEGIELIAVKTPIDTSNAGGRLQQNIQFIFSEYDNDLRREKCTEGMIEKLFDGYWVGRPPIGYDMRTVKGEQVMTINETGKLLRQAFIWKAQGIPNMEILIRLRSRGLNLYNQKLAWILNNVFYCGLISHGLLYGKVIEGKHPPLIPKDIFLQVNEINASYKHSKHREEYLDVPLKHFLKCGTCGTPFAGYIVKKKGLSYYKCNKTGCRCNKRADAMNDKFFSLLTKYAIREEAIPPLKEALSNTFHIVNEENVENSKLIKAKLIEIENDIATVDKRWALAKITEQVYLKTIEDLKKERKEILDKLKEVNFELSNLDEYIELSLRASCKILEMWRLDDYKLKEEVQTLLFPEGIYYDRENDAYRTERVNAAFKAITSLSDDFDPNKKGRGTKKVPSSNWVGPAGIEPATHRL